MKRESKDHYRILGLAPNASDEDIHKAYRSYAAKFHPDKHFGDVSFEQRFNEVKESYEFLSDPEKRRRYDIGRFGKSKVKLSGERVPEGMPKKFFFTISHPELYVAAFYFFNLTAWVIVRKNAERGYAWGLVISTFSSLFLWLFLTGWVEKTYRKSRAALAYWISWIVLSVALAGVLLFTNLTT